MQEKAKDPTHTVEYWQKFLPQHPPRIRVHLMPTHCSEAQRAQDRRDKVNLAEGFALWKCAGSAVKQSVFVLGLFMLFQATPFGSNPAFYEPQIYWVIYGLLCLLFYWPHQRRIFERADAEIAAIHAPPKPHVPLEFDGMLAHRPQPDRGAESLPAGGQTAVGDGE
jgi:hypothetical protein